MKPTSLDPLIHLNAEMDPETLAVRVDYFLREMGLPKDRKRLEPFSFPGSTNRVYRIPIGPQGQDTLILKLLPNRWVVYKKMFKRFLRNLIYHEHDVFTGKQRVRFEIERSREWAKEGLPVPPLVETSIPGARIFRGLNFPTFYTILTGDSFSTSHKLQILGLITKSLSYQHHLARVKNKQSLIHRDPGPWNIMFDPETETTYWFDLEHPAYYPRMTLEALMARALRIFVNGVLDHLNECQPEAIVIVTENYHGNSILYQLAQSMENTRRSRVFRVMSAVGIKRQRYLRHSFLASELALALQRRPALTGEDHMGLDEGPHTDGQQQVSTLHKVRSRP